ncbi:MAG: DUF3048 domain-containing protein [Actinomycetota bacterium]|nr:DUF3048 domain-containing protein [Actinomycetota bacterium]
MTALSQRLRALLATTPGRILAGVVVLAIIAVAVAVGTSGSAPKRVVQAAPSAPESPTPTPTPTPTPSPVFNGDPLTGADAKAAGPIVAIKVDNERLARPYQRGLDRAAVIYQELMEGGATRFAAMYEGPQDMEVGPIRSARESDLELFAQYGRVVLGFSGANRGVLAAVDKANVIGVANDRNSAPFRAGEHRSDANNFFTTPTKLIGAAGPGAVGPQDIGLRFGPLPDGLGTPAGGGNAVFPFGGSSSSFAFDQGSNSWPLAQDGRPMSLVGGGRVAPANVIVQTVDAKVSGYRDVLGAVTPYTVTVGTGPVVVFRDGKQIAGTWSRPDPAGGTHFLDPAGKDIPLRQGQTVILLLPREGSFTPS